MSQRDLRDKRDIRDVAISVDDYNCDTMIRERAVLNIVETALCSL